MNNINNHTSSLELEYQKILNSNNVNKLTKFFIKHFPDLNNDSSPSIQDVYQKIEFLGLSQHIDSATMKMLYYVASIKPEFNQIAYKPVQFENLKTLHIFNLAWTTYSAVYKAWVANWKGDPSLHYQVKDIDLATFNLLNYFIYQNIQEIPLGFSDDLNSLLKLYEAADFMGILSCKELVIQKLSERFKKYQVIEKNPTQIEELKQAYIYLHKYKTSLNALILQKFDLSIEEHIFSGKSVNILEFSYGKIFDRHMLKLVLALEPNLLFNLSVFRSINEMCLINNEKFYKVLEGFELNEVFETHTDSNSSSLDVNNSTKSSASTKIIPAFYLDTEECDNFGNDLATIKFWNRISRFLPQISILRWNTSDISFENKEYLSALKKIAKKLTNLQTIYYKGKFEDDLSDDDDLLWHLENEYIEFIKKISAKKINLVDCKFDQNCINLFFNCEHLTFESIVDQASFTAPISRVIENFFKINTRLQSLTFKDNDNLDSLENSIDSKAFKVERFQNSRIVSVKIVRVANELKRKGEPLESDEKKKVKIV